MESEGLHNPGSATLGNAAMLSRSCGPGVLKNKKSAQVKIPGRFLFFLIHSIAALHGGVGGFRTLVQTSNREAFYTFIFRLVFDLRPAENHQS